MNRKNPKVDAVLSRSRHWKPETQKLRSLILDSCLVEDLKWGKPCYTFQDSNVVIIQGFKSYFALMFFKGVLLKDPHGLLIKTGENTRVGRQIRFTSVRQIAELAPVVKSYLAEAVEVEKAGLKVQVERDAEPFPEELQARFDKLPSLKTAFHSLTPGRQRAYLLHFSGAKQSKTRQSRIEKCVRRILAGKGLDDQQSGA